MAAATSSKLVIYAALAGNLLVSVTKFIAATLTGSSAMLSEGVHSLVDTGNQALMLYGIHRSSKPADQNHPLGYGRELYFWSFIVALLIFSLGAGVSIYEGISHVLEPAEIKNNIVNYIVLGFSFVFESISWIIAWRTFSRHRGELDVVTAAMRSRDPTLFLVLFEDSAALIGIAIAFLGTMASERLAIPELDGVASIGIGLLLAATAAFLARESKGLLIGESAREPLRQSIRLIAREHKGVRKVGRLITIHLAPHQIVAAMNIEFDRDLSTAELERVAAGLDQKVREKYPDITYFFVSPKLTRE